MAANPNDTPKPAPGRKSEPADVPDRPAAGAPAASPSAGTPAPAARKAAASSDPADKPKPVGVREELEELQEKGSFYLFFREILRGTPGWMVSAVVHAILIVILLMITIAPPADEVFQSITSFMDNDSEKEEEITEINDELTVEDLQVSEVTEQVVETNAMEESPVVENFDELEAAPIAVELSPVGLDHAPKSDLMSAIGSVKGTDPLGGRGKAGRAVMVAQGGGTESSELAVGMGLKWLAAHQNADGGWSFNHGLSPTHVGPVNNPGKVASLTGATAMALLPFLGAGQTHKDGEYKDVVYKGLAFMTRAMKLDPNKGGNLMGEGGSLYTHGLASIVMCEAYALTQDRSLMVPAQQSLNFIIYAQDKTGGGWRYSPGQPGDTSVVGWQLMALKSGHLAYLQVPPQTVAGAINFLNQVQADDGAFYGYTAPGKGSATTAVGLLSRMYLGWKKDEPALERGVEYMAKLGPSKNNMYFNYYATQVMHHYGGEVWTKWNNVMRDQLVNSQVKAGDFRADKGSWSPTAGGHAGDAGGRLYETSMSVMTLEVYYRYLPLYKEQPVQNDF